MNTIEVYQGNTKTIKVTITDDDEAVDLNDFTCMLHVAELRIGEPILSIEGDVDMVTDNIVYFNLTTTDTEDMDEDSYWYQITITSLDMDKTVASGIFSVIHSLRAVIEP